MIEDKLHNNLPSSPGARLKEELKRRKISQRNFAEQIGMSPSHLSDIIRGARPLSMKTAEKLESFLGIPIAQWMDLQLQCEIQQHTGNNNEEEIRARKELEDYDKIISIKILSKKAGAKQEGNKQFLDSLRNYYSLPSPEALNNDSDMLRSGLFKKSSKTGLDARMIATWVVLARHAVKEQNIVTQFNPININELGQKLASVFHSNFNTIIRTHDVLANYGIKFAIVERLDHASIDGYSFIDGKTPAIVVTKRYDRIDNFAFAVLHEVFHAYKHLNDKRHQRISIVDYDTESKEEIEANDFASNILVNPNFWSDAPTVQLNKPWVIQKKYSSWAEKYHLNKWIVLGQISHATGMYKFKSDDSRKIH
ncbi:MAG: helix-turn-helix domain-containing protein [Prevotella sp.]|jgi:HTH-type transcriptional regulator/antitoxin HigA